MRLTLAFRTCNGNRTVVWYIDEVGHGVISERSKTKKAWRIAAIDG
jgi:hypothetical protein